MFHGRIFFKKAGKTLFFLCDDFGVLNGFWINLALSRQEKIGTAIDKNAIIRVTP